MRNAVLVLLAIGGLALAALWGLGRGAFGRFDSDIVAPVDAVRSSESVAADVSAQRAAAREIGAPDAGRQILFGDLHVHTTISFDAFMLGLPAFGGPGAAPPADACDFARHCAALDFWSINDHAANIAPRDWHNTVEAIRRCEARAGDPANPDLVSFLGWEWTQAGDTPDTHYGHKNVVLRGTADTEIPTRPIAATAGGVASNPPPTLARGALALADARFRDLAARWTALSDVEICEDAPVRELPAECREIAPTPADLFRKLDDWGHEAIVIPHGTAWGIYTPPRSSWDGQLEGAQHDPARQTLIEVYSGHGDSELYRDWRALDVDDGGRLVCPEPSDDYVPICWRAGEIIEERCRAAGENAPACAERAAEARANAAGASVSPHAVVPGVTAAELGAAGQCRDCEQPAFNYRPGGSVQYISALGDFGGGGDEPHRFRMGFIASSDIHSARPGTGYKELRALSETPARELPDEPSIVTSFLLPEPEEPAARSRSYEEAKRTLSGLQLYENERVRSYLYTGGLVAVHARGRSRDAIWDALDRKEVYGTSGPRILLWFDLLGESGALPMGSEVAQRDAPVFRVRAVGSFEQAPGCPESALAALGPERTADLCAGECYRPTDRRRRIERIEVVRIRPQASPDEDVGALIDDPWRSFDCPDDHAGCVATFVDAGFPALAREALYYARAFEEPTPTVNGTQTPCPDTASCLGDYAHRAWSSPIWIEPAR